jgi:hypothetical protein
VSTLALEKPRGVSLSKDNENFIFSYGLGANLVLVSTTTLMPLENTLNTGMYITWSHLINWYREVERLRMNT